MTIIYSTITPENLPLVRELIMQFWEKGWDYGYSVRFLDWRYLRRKGGDPLVAFDAGRCIAILDSWLRPHLLNGRITAVREICDWFCLPEYRSLGLNLLLRFMQRPEPILSVAGNVATTVAILPQAGFRHLQDAYNYELIVGSGPLVASWLRQYHLPGTGILCRIAHNLSVRVIKPRLQSPPSHLHAVKALQAGMAPSNRDIEGYGLAPVLCGWEGEWFATAPEGMGQFMWLDFTLNGETVGNSLSRIFRGEHFLEGVIVHLQHKGHAVELLGWMLSATARHLARAGAHTIRCRATCPVIGQALAAVGFKERYRSPVLWWSRDGEIPQGPLHLSLLRADDGIRPYPP